MSALYSETLFQFSEMCAFHFSFVHLYTLYKYNWYKHQVAQITNNKKEAVSPIVNHVDHSYLYLQSKARALCCILKSIGCCVLLISCFGGAGAVRAYVDWCRMRAWCLEQKWAAHVSGVQRSGVALLLGRFIHCRTAVRAATKRRRLEWKQFPLQCRSPPLCDSGRVCGKPRPRCKHAGLTWQGYRGV